MNIRNLRKLLQTESFYCKLGVEVIKFARNFSFIFLFLFFFWEIKKMSSIFVQFSLVGGLILEKPSLIEMQGWINWAVYFENGLSPFFFLILRYLRVCVWIVWNILLTGIKFFLWFCDRKHVKKNLFFFFLVTKKAFEKWSRKISDLAILLNKCSCVLSFSNKKLHYNRAGQQCTFLMHLVRGWHLLCRKENNHKYFQYCIHFHRFFIKHVIGFTFYKWHSTYALPIYRFAIRGL